MTSRVSLMVALTLLAVAPPVRGQSADDDDASPEEAVDAGPYVAALATSFAQCLSAEDPEAPPAPGLSDEITQAMGSFALLMGRDRPEGACTADEASVLACAADVATWSCEQLAQNIEAAMSPSMPGGGEPPPWARSYAAAMSGKVGECFTEEAGQPLGEAQAADLATYEDMLAGAMGGVGAACPLVEERFAECLSGIALLDCGALAAQLSGDAASTANAFVAQCEGFLDCGF